MIRVLYLVDQIASPTGGSENQLLTMLKRLDRSRFDPCLVCLRSTPWQQRASAACPNEVLDFNYFYAFDFFRAGRRFETICRDREIDIVQTFLRDANILGVLWARRAGVPVTIVSRRSIGTGYWYTWRHVLALRYLAKHTTHYLANSHAAAQEAIRCERLDPDRVSVIPNGLEPADFTVIDDNSIREIRAKWGVSPDSTVIGAVANLRTVKNLPFLVEIAPKIVDSFPRAAFVVLGEGPERGHLEDLVRRHGLAGRFFLPGVSREAARDVQAFDIGVLVSHSESSPNAVVEYMAAGRPSVSADVGGTHELFTHGETGYVFPAGDKDRFRELLTLLLQDGQRRSQMGNAARQEALRRHDWTTVLPQIEDTYSSLVARHGRSSGGRGKAFRSRLATHVEDGLKNLVKHTLTATGAHRLARRRNRAKVLIVMYHGITTDATTFDRGHVTLAEFEKQMVYLKTNYNVVPLGDVVEMLVSGDIAPGTAAVTFDDGYRSTFRLAYPVLKQAAIPATVYVISQFVADTREEARYMWTDYATILMASSGVEQIDLRWCGLGRHTISDETSLFNARYKITDRLKSMPAKEKDVIVARLERDYGANIDRSQFSCHEPMIWSEVREMVASGLVAVGAHTRTHPILSRVDPALLENEILGSKADIENHLGTTVHDFAYPNGRAADISPESVEVAKKGFRSAATAVEGLNAAGQDPYALLRIGISSELSLDQYKTLLSGLYGLVP